jgi:hypothetical protein
VPLQVSQEAAFTAVYLTDLTLETKHRLLEEEGQMAAADSLQRATDEAKNALEEYVYALRSKVQGECASFVKEADREGLVSELNDLENWLYEDGEDEMKSVRILLTVAQQYRGMALLSPAAYPRSSNCSSQTGCLAQLPHMLVHKLGCHWINGCCGQQLNFLTCC